MPGLEFSISEPIRLAGVAVGPDGQIALIADGKAVPLASAAAEVSYERAKGRKVLARVPLDPAHPTLDLNEPLRHFKAVVGVDTNTRTIRGIRVSVGCMVQLLIRTEGEGGTTGSASPLAAVQLHNAEGDPERIVWRLTCEAIMRRPAYDPRTPIGLVVDSSLREIPAFNRRELPIVGDWLLPIAFTLIYATSDSSSASFANRLIADCDRHARALLDDIEQGAANVTLSDGQPGDPWSQIGWRSWTQKGAR